MAVQLLDTNVIVHAAYSRSALHEPSASLLDRSLRARGEYCIAPQNLLEFMAVVTRPGFVDPPLAPSEAGRIARRLYRSRTLAKIYPQRGTVERCIDQGVMPPGLGGLHWFDSFLVATMRDAGVHAIVTENVRDFRGFRGIVARKIAEAAGDL